MGDESNNLNYPWFVWLWVHEFSHIHHTHYTLCLITCINPLNLAIYIYIYKERSASIRGLGIAIYYNMKISRPNQKNWENLCVFFCMLSPNCNAHMHAYFNVPLCHHLSFSLTRFLLYISLFKPYMYNMISRTPEILSLYLKQTELINYLIITCRSYFIFPPSKVILSHLTHSLTLVTKECIMRCMIGEVQYNHKYILTKFDASKFIITICYYLKFLHKKLQTLLIKT